MEEAVLLERWHSPTTVPEHHDITLHCHGLYFLTDQCISNTGRGRFFEYTFVGSPKTSNAPIRRLAPLLMQGTEKYARNGTDIFVESSAGRLRER
jgi:hypothetical protein